MSCDTFQDAIVDVARGRDVGTGTVGVVESHIEHCATCRARFMREQHLSEALRALARSTDSQGASSAVEARLLAAFSDKRAVNREPRVANYVSWMQAAAAIALLTASAVTWWWVSSRPRVEEIRTASTVMPKPLESKTAASQPSETHAPSVAIASAAVSSEPRRRPASTTRGPASRVVKPEGFVALPMAAGLPAFESGEIVRVEVPVTSLPMYGIDIAPDARGSAVEADFLVGQDGQARAIRLVRNGRL
jgi:hypothetical protein